MKKALYILLQNTDDSMTLLDNLKNNGYGGTVFQSASLKHVLEGTDSDEKHFINLADLESKHLQEETFIFIVVDEEKLEDLKNIIRAHTQNFTKIKGGMYSHDLTDFEGSF